MRVRKSVLERLVHIGGKDLQNLMFYVKGAWLDATGRIGNQSSQTQIDGSTIENHA